MAWARMGKRIKRLLGAWLIVTVLTSCATTFVPISWGMREKVLLISRQDDVLAILFQRYDPGRKTLRVDGASFNIVEGSHDNWKHVGAYRPEHLLIYRNLETTLDDRDLRNVMVHEMAHHIWFNFLSSEQKEGWTRYLRGNPSRWQAMVRRTYEDRKQYDTEDFAYTIEFPRKSDIAALAELAIISADEMGRWLQTTLLPESSVITQGAAVAEPRQ